MKNSKHPAKTSILHWIVFLLLGSTTLVITVNSYDSGIAKTPLLVLCASLLVVVYVAQTIRREKLEFRKTPADLPVLAFMVVMITSTSYSQDLWSSQQALMVWIPFIICFFAGTQLFAGQKELDKLIQAAAIAASMVCLVGLVQFFFNEELFLDFFIGKDRRVNSTLTNATYLSGYIALLFPTLLAFAIAEERKPWKRWSLIMLLSGLAFILFVTLTRSSIAAFALSMILFGILSQHAKKKTFVWAAAVIVIASAILFLSPILTKRIEESFKSDANSSFARRTYFWTTGYEAFKASPYFGHGIGSYWTVMLDYRSPEYWVVKSEDVVPHAHNELVETAVDLGAAGVIAYLAILGTVLVVGLKAPPNEGGRDRLLRVGLLCSVVAILIDNLSNVSLRAVPVGAAAWLLMGVLVSRPSTYPVRGSRTLSVPQSLAYLPIGGWLVFTFWYGSQQLKLFTADAHIIRGIFSVIAKNVDLGIREYQFAVALDPHNLIARSNMTLALLMKGRNEEALLSAEQLQELSPRYPKSNLMRAAALVSLKRYPEALEFVDRELKLRSHPEAYFYKSAAFIGLGDSISEVRSLKDLLHANVKGQLAYQLEYVSKRVLQVVQRGEDLEEFREIYMQLALVFPSDKNIPAVIGELESKLARLHGS